MRQKNIILACALVIAFVPTFSSSTLATKSRLMGMGDLSIVIADQSDPMDLWSWGQNPAGFLDDGRESTLRWDFLWSRRRLDNLLYHPHPVLDPYTSLLRVESRGDMLDNSISLSQCRKGDFALGIGGSYLARNADTEYDGHDLDNPDFLVVFSRSVSRTLSLGASFSHVEHNFAFSRGGSDPAGHVLLATDETFSGNRVQIGLKGKFGSRLTVRYGLHVGYERLRITRSYSNGLGGASWATTYHSHLPWVSEQILVQLERLLWLGTEVRVRFLNDAALGKGRHYRYYYRLRGVWSPSSRLRLGGFYCDGDSFTETHEPLLSYFSSIRQDRYLREWGVGVAWRCHQRLLAGAEYCVGEYPEPVSNSFPWILPEQMKINSLHLGVEGQLTRGLSIRGGFITSLGDPGRTYTYWAYDFEPSAVTWVYRKDSRENTVTLGCGLEPSDWNVVLEFSYRYTFKSYRDWYLEGEDVKSRASLLTFSFKRKL